MNQPDLFDTFSIKDYQSAFDAWLLSRRAAGRIRHDSSAGLYQDMWGSFMAWCAVQNPPVALSHISRQDIQLFQSSRFGVKALDISARHARRLLRLIDQVLLHQADSQDVYPNMAASEAINAQPDVRYAEAAGNDPLPQILDAKAAKQLIIFLTNSRPGKDADATQLSWQILRNRVAVALQLGAGLTPADVRFLKLNSPVSATPVSSPGVNNHVENRPWKLQIAGNGNTPAHEAPLAAWAAELLAYWIQVRRQQALAGDWLFPSTRSGKQLGKIAQYNAARKVMQEAGLESLDGGSFRLRHTFALRQLTRGTSPEQVAQWLGVNDAKVMERYNRILDRAPTVV